MSKRIALTALGFGSPLLLLGLVVGGPAGEWIFALLAVAFPVLLIAQGAARRGRLGRVGPVLLLLGLVLEAATVGILLLDGRPPGERAPPGASGLAWMLGGLGLVPLVLVSLGFAATFDPEPADEDSR